MASTVVDKIEDSVNVSSSLPTIDSMAIHAEVTSKEDGNDTTGGKNTANAPLSNTPLGGMDVLEHEEVEGIKAKASLLGADKSKKPHALRNRRGNRKRCTHLSSLPYSIVCIYIYFQFCVSYVFLLICIGRTSQQADDYVKFVSDIPPLSASILN